jgi:hypothetical protein
MLPAIIVLMLSACSTVPEVTLLDCPVASPELNSKADKLPPLTVAPMSQSDVVTNWIFDIEQYNLLVARHNALIDHIRSQCKWPGSDS